MNQHVKPMTLIKETDYGTKTPEVHETTKMVTLEIDGAKTKTASLELKPGETTAVTVRIPA